MEITIRIHLNEIEGIEAAVTGCEFGLPRACEQLDDCIVEAAIDKLQRSYPPKGKFRRYRCLGKKRGTDIRGPYIDVTIRYDVLDLARTSIKLLAA